MLESAVLLSGALTALAVDAAMASAGPISNDAFGVYVGGAPPNLSVASAAGVGVARAEAIDGTNTDALVELAAAAGLRLYPMLGIPVSHGAAADAAEMAAYVTIVRGCLRSGRNVLGPAPWTALPAGAQLRNR